MKMKLQTCSVFATVMLLMFAASVSAQPPASAQSPISQPLPRHDQFGADPVRQLNLTPEQRERIRTIREESREERARIQERLHAANRALEDALESDNPDESVVEERAKEVVAAQSAAMRLRVLTEVRIRRVLTAEQKTLLRTLRQQAAETRRERRIEADERQRHRRTLRMRDRNRIGPQGPAGDLQRRPLN